MNIENLKFSGFEFVMPQGFEIYDMKTPCEKLKIGTPISAENWLDKLQFWNIQLPTILESYEYNSAIRWKKIDDWL